MMIEQTISKLKSMKLSGMVNAYQEQAGLSDVFAMSFDERFGLITDREEIERENKKFQSRLKKARMREQACIESLDFNTTRGIDKSQILSLRSNEWIKRFQNILITGPTGVGKTYLGCALLHEACRNGYSARCIRLPRLLEEIAIAKADGSFSRVMDTLAKTQVLLLDDWGISVFNEEQRRLILEIVEDRYGLRSTIITSQIPVDQWFDIIGDATLADAIMDRIVNGAYKLTLKGASMRRVKPSLTEKKD